MMDIREAGRAVGPLRLVLWSAPLLVFASFPWWDISFLVALPGDLLSSVLFGVATLGLSEIAAGRGYRRAMRPARDIFLVKASATAIMLPAAFVAGLTESPFLCLICAPTLVAIALLVIAMRRFCAELELAALWAYWSTSLYVVGVFLMAPSLVRVASLFWFPETVLLWAPVPLAAIGAASIMHSTRNTIRTIMFFEHEEEKEGVAGGGRVGAAIGRALRTISAAEITDAVKRLALDAAFVLDDGTLRAIEDARGRERSPVGREVLGEILENARVAGAERRPLCQDTGLAVVAIELGQDVRIEGALDEAVNEGVRLAWREGGLRNSVVRDPIARENTGDNTPAFLHVDLVPGEKVRVSFLAKGGGSENQSRVGVLKPAEGREGVIDFVTSAVREAAPFACPPVVVGVGLGGTVDRAAWLAKKALFRPLGEPSVDADTAALECEILEKANATGVGPMGLGGTVTALAVHVERASCHIASLPVAVCFNCHSHRVRSLNL